MRQRRSFLDTFVPAFIAVVFILTIAGFVLQVVVIGGVMANPELVGQFAASIVNGFVQGMNQ